MPAKKKEEKKSTPVEPKKELKDVTITDAITSGYEKRLEKYKELESRLKKIEERLGL
tara:strand:+ start:1054 stop:1224 length:171 start_codon:yes stop_codon:yes gene_type:complete